MNICYKASANVDSDSESEDEGEDGSKFELNQEEQEAVVMYKQLLTKTRLIVTKHHQNLELNHDMHEHQKRA